MANFKILLAEDDADHQRLMLMSLARHRGLIDVVATSTAVELLEAARTRRFDCIVLDFNLPPATATELIPELARLQEGVPCIVVSSSEEQRIVVESLRNGVADFMRKEEAFDGAVCWKRIEQVVEAARERRREQRKTNRRLVTLQRQAETDSLTGLSNRRYAERVLAGLRRRGDRRRTIALTLIDLDHFKRVNDSLGHDAGDQVLREAAVVLRRCVPRSAIAARWGGEEFLVIGFVEDVTEAWIWADDVRAAIGSDISVGAPIGRITASIGVAVIPSGELCEASISRADRAMYLAKDSGRNRTCTWSMVEAMDVALEMQTHTKLSPRERLRAVIERVRGALGKTQLEHVGPHGMAVRGLAHLLAPALFRDAFIRDDLELAAEFHDVGKVGVPEALLALPRSLNEGERRFVNEHARFGAELLAACGASERAVRAVERHHHRHDAEIEAKTRGEGAPGLEAVLSACDAVVAMISDRPYCETRTARQALAELRAERGRQFHPDVVDALQFVDRDAIAA